AAAGGEDVVLVRGVVDLQAGGPLLGAVGEAHVDQGAAGDLEGRLVADERRGAGQRLGGGEARGVLADNVALEVDADVHTEALEGAGGEAVVAVDGAVVV